MQLWDRLCTKFLPIVAKRRFRVEPRGDLRRLGSEYGGWLVPLSLLSASSTCYCVGVGEDISFDRALMDATGCEVHAFDPTPKAKRFVTEHCTRLPRFHFHDVGVWNEDTVVRFFAPQDPTHASYSISNLQHTEQFVEAPCKRLATLTRELRHDRIDLLKLDVEGAEYPIIAGMLADGVRPRVFCVEFHLPSFAKVRAAVRGLQSAGYDLVQIDFWNYTFVHSNAAP